MIGHTTVGRTPEVTKVLPEWTVGQQKITIVRPAGISPSRICASKGLVLPLCSLMANGPIQSVSLVAAVHALEDGNAPAADPLEEARPD